MREITVATVQMKPALGEIEDNLVKMSEFVSKIASQQKVDLIVFPELITSGYELGVRFTELAQRIPGPSVNVLAQRAAEFGVYIAFGMAAKERVESVLYNSAVLVGPDGELVGNYNKIHLRGEERMAFREGFRLPVFETEFGVLGLMLGWDLAFPEVARSLTLEGAELLAVMANWEADQMEEWRTFVRARSYENGLFVAAANRAGEDVTLSFGGESMVVGPGGKTYAYLETPTPEPEKPAEPEKKDEAAGDEKTPEKKAEKKSAAEAKPGEPPEGFVVARIDLEDVRRHREERQTIQARQPSVYRALVRRY
ncbi:carbon-nitrogen hydrolase family protein [Aggregatilinea lenta]|uniref:carbon-nitrogen hydrolase family protein n=1 Tax=Aggregatilinea lenta TaxID=913108 RepID=UPI000E5A731B|nr:carbon-nitrogen hydrolase family protein [Aggregatilinea lenta]